MEMLNVQDSHAANKRGLDSLDQDAQPELRNQA